MIGTVLHMIWIIVQVTIGFNLVFPLLLFLFYSLVKGKYRPKKPLDLPYQPDYAVIVTAYEQTDNLPSVVKSLLKLNYPNYLIYIVADKCEISGLHFDSDKVVLLRP